MRPEHLNYMTQLKGIARNLNQLTRSANAGGFTTVIVSHTAIITEIEDFLKQVRHDREDYRRMILWCDGRLCNERAVADVGIRRY